MAEGATIIGRVAVKVIPDTQDFRSETQHALNEIERELDSIKVNFEVDAEQLRREVNDAIDDAQRDADDVEVKLDIHEATKKKIQAQLAFLAHTRFVDIVPRINKTAYAKTMGALAALSGARAFKDLTTDFVDWVSNLDKALPKMAAMSLAVTNLGGSLLAGTSNVLSFSSSLASIAPAALALPGILGGIAIGTGAMIAVLKDFNTRIPEMADKLHTLQNQMSSKFWDKAEEPIRRLIDSLFPQFSAAIQRTSADLGTFFARLSNSARDVFDGELDQMFNDLNRSIRIASQYTDSFVGIIEKLGSVGAGNLPRLARWFGDISDQFDRWLGRKGTKGLQNYVDTGIEALKDLGGVLSNTGSLLAGLAQAAETGGGGTLQSLRDLTESAAKVVNGPKFQGALSNMFAGAHEGMDELTKRSGPAFESFMGRLANTLSRVLPLAGQAAGDALSGIFSALDQSGVEESVVGVFRKLGKAVDNVAPSLDEVADGLAGIIDIAGDVGVQLSRALGPALKNLGDNADVLSGDLEPLVKQLGDLLVNAVEVAGPLLSDLVSIVGDLAGILAVVLKPINGFIDLMQKLPGPVKEVISNLTAIGILVGASAWFGLAVRNKIMLTGSSLLLAGEKATVAGGMLTRAGTMAQAAAGRFSLLKGAGVVAGLSLLSLSTQADNTNGAMSSLTKIGGAAVTGFFLGGPWGAALGAGGAALLDFKAAGEDTIDMEKQLALSMQDVIATLNQQTGAFTNATKAKVVSKLEDAGLLKQAQELNIPLDQLTRTLFQGEDAIDRWRTKALAHTETDAQATAVYKLADGMKTLNAEVFGGQSAWAREQEAMGNNVQAYQRAREAIRRLGEDYNLMPKQVKTIFEAVKLNPTIQNVKHLAKQYDLTPKQVKTIVGVIGTKTTLKEIGATRKELEKLKATKGDLKAFQKGVNTDLDKLKKVVHQKAQGAVRELEQELAKGKAEMPKLNPSLRTLMGGAARTASSASPQVGENLKAGIISGFEGTSTILAQMASNAVLAAIRSAKSAGDIHSPSRKMYAIGRFLGKGLGLGLESTNSENEGIAYAAITRLLKVVSTTATKAHTKLANQITQLKNKYEQAFKKAGEAQKKQLKNQLKNVLDVNKAYEAQWTKLDKTATKLKSLMDAAKAYKQAVIEQIVATGDPTQDGTNTFQSIVEQMTIARDEAVKFAKVIAQLVKDGLNKDTIAQLVAAGPQAALAAAQAIEAAGHTGIGQINDLMSQIKDAGKDLGTTATESLFAAQIAATKADLRDLLKAIKPLQDKLTKAVKQLMEKLAAEIRKGNKKIEHEVGNTGKGSGSDSNSGSSNRPLKKTGTDFGVGRSSGTAGTTNVLNYYAQPGPALSSEESLFTASKRGRMVFG